MSSLAVFGGSFNPPGSHHRLIAEKLLTQFDRLAIVPCGPRADKPTLPGIESVHRAAMVDLAFQDLPRTQVDLFDLEAAAFSPTILLDEQYRAQGDDVWHVIGTDLVAGGAQAESPIQRYWVDGRRLWQEAQFVVIPRPGVEISSQDLPPKCRVLEMQVDGASSQIRQRAFRGESLDGLLPRKVQDYLTRHHLYQGARGGGQSRVDLHVQAVELVYDETNPQARQIAGQLSNYGRGTPDVLVVIGGDGTMLRAIRQHWRRRIPFLGINTGHLGFLLNDGNPHELLSRELILQASPLLWAQFERLSGEVCQSLAFNDAWVERTTGQTAWIQVEVNGRVRLERLVADGALVATAAGSTGYARAMGGVSLPVGTPVLLLVGSNVLSPDGWKPAVLPLDSEVRLTTLDSDKRPLQGYLDGVNQGVVKSMQVRTSRIAAVELAFAPGRDPAEKLSQIQFPLP